MFVFIFCIVLLKNINMGFKRGQSKYGTDWMQWMGKRINDNDKGFHKELKP